MAAIATARKKKSTKFTPRPLIENNRNYSRKEGALACGVSIPTLYRAYQSGNLKAYRCGARVIHSGQHLLDWLESGGKTAKVLGSQR